MIKRLITFLLLLTSVNLLFAQRLIRKFDGKQYFFVNEKGKKASKTKYDDAHFFRGGRAAVKVEDKWGYLNKEMELIIPAQYEDINDFHKGRALVRASNKSFFIDSAGTQLGESHDSIFFMNKYLVIIDEGLYGILDEEGAVLESPKFEAISGFYDEKFTLKQDGKWGNWKDGVLDFENPTLYMDDPDTPPMLTMDCLEFTETTARDSCSIREIAYATYKSIKYPPMARENGVEGTVVIRFVINTEGQMVDPQIVRDIGAQCGAESLRVAKENLKYWARPGMHEGQAINSIYNLSVRFRLN